MNSLRQEHRIRDWRSLKANPLFTEISPSHDWIWRGQSQAWELTPSLWRHSLRFDYDGWDLVDKHLREFVASGSEPVRKELNIAHYSIQVLSAFAQHHGLLTPSLDWTKDPKIALFFAFADDQTDSENVDEAQCRVRCIDALHLPTIREYHTNLLKSESRMAHHDPKDHLARGLEPIDSDSLLGDTDEFEQVGPAIGSTYWLTRLRAQKAVLLFVWRAGAGKSVEAHLPNAKEHVPGISRPIWHRFLISENVLRDRIECLNELDAQGVSYRSLFPDWEGLAWHTNLKVRLTGYCGANPHTYQSDRDPYHR